MSSLQSLYSLLLPEYPRASQSIPEMGKPVSYSISMPFCPPPPVYFSINSSLLSRIAKERGYKQQRNYTAAAIVAAASWEGSTKWIKTHIWISVEISEELMVVHNVLVHINYMCMFTLCGSLNFALIFELLCKFYLCGCVWVENSYYTIQQSAEYHWVWNSGCTGSVSQPLRGHKLPVMTDETYFWRKLWRECKWKVKNG